MDQKVGVCSICGPVKLSTWTTGGKLQRRCYNARRSDRGLGDRRYRTFKKDYCENSSCVAIIEDKCQLDVDHIDGNHKNDDPANLMTLCANCHRLKTHGLL